MVPFKASSWLNMIMYNCKYLTYVKPDPIKESKQASKQRNSLEVGHALVREMESVGLCIFECD